MKRITLAVALLGLGLSVQTANAQLAKQKGITIEEIGKKINELAQKGDDSSKEQMEFEAKALASTKNEQFNNLAARIYSFLDKADEVKKIDDSILKKYPKGLKARQEAYSKIFNDKEISAAEAEKQFNAFKKTFPEKNFEEKDRTIYSYALGQLANLYVKENKIEKGLNLLEASKSNRNYVSNAYTVTTTLINDHKNYKAALPILEDLYTKSLDSKNPEARYASSVLAQYSSALTEENQAAKAIELLESFFSKQPERYSSTVVTLAKAYSKEGRDLDAFVALNDQLIKDPKNKELIELVTPLYSKLNQQNGKVEDYLASVAAKAKEAKIAKYKSDMIKKEAPAFSLVNMKGETVSLADLKGKVVILDFWATWCGPCVNSFPGMQAAVNKYKDDKEVEFLFIDTWQREENYKEVVEKFIAKNNYTFHVLFDEMKDRAKATTTAYGVQGIPHKVVIDKEGFIRFESSGSGSNIDEIVDELSTKIELVRKG